MATSTEKANPIVKKVQVQPRAKDQSAALDDKGTGSSKLQQNLLKAISTSATRADALTAVMHVMMGSLRPVGLLYFERDATDQLSALAELSPAGTGNVQPVYRRPLKNLCDAACEKGSLQVSKHDAKGRLMVVAAPVMLRGQAPEAIGAIFAGANIDQAVGVMQVVAAHITLWQVLEVTKVAEHESKSTAALLELLGKCDSARTLHEGSITLVNELKDYLECGQVALGVCGFTKNSCRLRAVSGMSQFDKRSEFASSLEAALDEAILRDQLTIWPAAKGSQKNPALSHRRVCEVTGHEGVISSPLYDDQDNLVGAWLFLGEKSFVERDDIIDFTDASQRLVGATLQLLQRAEMNPLSRCVRWITTRLSTRKAKATIALGLIAFLTMCLPVKYRVGCDCQVQPVVRRFVAAPYDGKLEKSLVEPGDQVTEHQLLARLDGRELRWELAGLEAELNRAEKSRDSAMAIGSMAEAQQADLEYERVALKIKLLQNRLDRLEVRSPLSGIVISGDLKKTVGAPLSVGQVLFEISPLDRMIVEVAIPEREILHVMRGMEVVFRVDAYPGKKWSGIIHKIFPRAEMRESESIYLAEVHLDNASGELRPGMKGQARVIGQRHKLGWNLFHKPYESLGMLIGF
jgi:biotin carboxyl carrier protein